MQNIYLVGFMGTGKTETAKALAKLLGRSFVDMDDLIETRAGMLIPGIFRIKGESYFRTLEKEVVAELASQDGLVVACGGGAFAVQENIDLFKKSGIVVCLTSTPETILKRTQWSTHRPLLDVQDPRARIEEMLKKRAPFYAQAHHTVDADKLSVTKAAEAVLKILKEEQ